MKATDSTANEELRKTKVIELHLTGMSRRNIAKTTGETEHYIRKVTSGITEKSSITPFDKSVDRIYEFACRAQGVKDYELRNILHCEYGCDWNHSEGRYESLFDKDTIKRVKSKVKERASTNGLDAKFLPDWVSDAVPTASRVKLEQAANSLASRLDELVSEFMFECGEDVGSEAASKQQYAARRHVLKLLSGLGQEPVSTLLERTKKATDTLDGNSDISAPERTMVRRPADRFILEPNMNDYFLDFAEDQGWLKEAA